MYINQVDYEDMLIEGKKVQRPVHMRKTQYHIYLISKEICREKAKNYCNNYCTGSIAMVSRCISSNNEDCEPKVLVDLLNSTKSNLRNLEQTEEIKDLKNFPIALCLFTFIDTNNISSISCHESLPENIKNEILSDLYYFRPVAKLAYKEDEFFIKEEKDKKTIIRKSKGKCNIKHNETTHCVLDMNITKDINGNLIEFNEKYLSNITSSDKLNEFNKYKKTKLIDETSNIISLNKEEYKSNLNIILNKLKPYLKNETFSFDKNMTRKLSLFDDKYFEKGQSLFFKEYMGIDIDFIFKYNSGLNTETMKAFTNLNFDEKKNELVYKQYFSNLNRAIKKLFSLSKSGNYIAYLLYEKMKKILDNLTQEITIKIRNLNSLIVYKDLTEIYDSTLLMNEIQILPNYIIEKSYSLFNKLNTSLMNIENNKIENINYLDNATDEYYSSSYNYLNKTFFNLKKLEVLVNSLKSFTENSNSYFNNTVNSYIESIQKINDIYTNYWRKENNIIENEIEIFLKDFEDNYFNSIKKGKNIVNNLYLRSKNKSLTIINSNEENYQQFENNLINSNSISENIFNKIKDIIQEIFIDKKNENILSETEKKDFNQTLKESKEIADKLYNDENKDKIFEKIMTNFKENITNIITYMDIIKEEKFTLIDDPLKEGFFTSSIKNNIKDKISKCGIDIINIIKKENNEYITNKNEKLNLSC